MEILQGLQIMSSCNIYQRIYEETTNLLILNFHFLGINYLYLVLLRKKH